ncbi:MAG: ATP-grasp domain-containing protein [Pyrinomonadaceae bacterium]
MVDVASSSCCPSTETEHSSDAAPASRKEGLLVMLGFSDGLAHAAEAGVRTAVLSPQFSLEEILRIDRPVRVNLDDEITVRKELVKLNETDGVLGVVAFDDALVALAARARSWLGLQGGPKSEAVRRCLRKDEMRRALAEDPQLAIPYRSVREPEELEAAVDEIGLPCVVKPVDSSNSRHVYFCDTRAKAVAAGKKVLEWSLTAGAVSRVLIEPFFSGPEFSVECYTFEGRTVVMAVCEKVLGPLPYFVEIGHILPTRQPGNVEELAAETARKALSVLQVDDLVTHTEVRLTPSGFKVIEINPRPAGGRLREFIQVTTGYDLHGVAIQIAAGRAPTRHAPGAAQGIYHCITADVEGTVVYDTSYLRRPLQVGFYPIVELTVNPGERVYPVNHEEGKVLGRILAYGQNFDSAAEEVRRILCELRFQSIPSHNAAARGGGRSDDTAEGGGARGGSAETLNRVPAPWVLSPPAGLSAGPGQPACYVPAWVHGIGWTWLAAHPADVHTGVSGSSERPASPAEFEPPTGTSGVQENSCQGAGCGSEPRESSGEGDEAAPKESGAWNRGCC